MGETILVSVGLVLLLVVVGVALYLMVTKARMAQDRRDYIAADRGHADHPPAGRDDAGAMDALGGGIGSAQSPDRDSPDS